MPAAHERPLVLITAPFLPAVATSLSDDFSVYRFEPLQLGQPLCYYGLNDVLAHARALVVELDRVDVHTLEMAPNLSLIVGCRASPVNVDIAECTRRGIVVSTTPGRKADVTADLTMSLLLATVRHTSRAEAWMRTGAWVEADRWAPYQRFRGIALKGRVLGVVGAGAVGRRVVKRALAFGMEVLVHDPFVPASTLGEEVTVLGLDHVLSRSDVVTIHVPLDPSTTAMIGRREIALMKPGSYIINAGRAAVVDEDALLEALGAGHLAGAGLDVYWAEPLPTNHRLFDLPNVVLTPHIGGASDDVIVEQSRMAAEALRAWAAGRQPAAVVNAAELRSIQGNR